MFSVKRIFIMSYIVLCLSSFLCLMFNTKPTKEPIRQSSEEQKVDVRYTVKAFNGRIAVFKNDSTNPSYILDSPKIYDLPDFDQKLLNEGIVTDSEEELSEILEDYDS